MNRDEMLLRLSDASPAWDIIVIGGGATGLGTALDAASRGLRTLLLEQGDFARGTSSRSTKLIHGGVRYLQQGNVGLVLEALRDFDDLSELAWPSARSRVRRLIDEGLIDPKKIADVAASERRSGLVELVADLSAT